MMYRKGLIIVVRCTYCSRVDDQPESAMIRTLVAVVVDVQCASIAFPENPATNQCSRVAE